MKQTSICSGPGYQNIGPTFESLALIGSNDDLLTEILIRLPVNSILVFKLVSKHWRLLLSDRHFTNRYDNNNNNNPSKYVGLFGHRKYVPYDVENRSPPPFRSLDSYFSRFYVRIVQSCNGILLCRAFHKDDSEYYVFNPTTKQLAIIPSLPKKIWAMALAFHQTHCVHYKVVCVRRLETSGTEMLLQIQVYYSDTGKWKICIESFSADIFQFSYPVYWNGAVHWAPYYHRGSNFLYFKLDVEQLQMLAAPGELVSKGEYDEVYTMYFGESRGHLHLISHPRCEDEILQLNVCEMLTDRSGWFVKYRVQLLGFPEVFDSRVVDVVRGKVEEETFLVLVTPEKVTRYNVYHKSFNHIYSQPTDDFESVTLNCHRYIATLSSF